MPVTNECKRILAYAAEGADRLSQRAIGTGHLFLGILRQHDCFAAKLLSEIGVQLKMARERIESSPPQQLGSPPKSPGLPAGYTSHKLLYNSAAEMLILELRASSRFLLPTRLFIRHIDVEAYEQIGDPSEDVSYETPVTGDGHPLLVFNSMKLDKARTGGNWGGAYSFNLKSKELARCISLEGLRRSEPHGRLWITELVSLSEDARTVYVNIGVAKIVSGGGVIEHYFARVELADQEVKLLSRLMDIRF